MNSVIPSLGESEYRFACLVWANEPVASGELVKLAARELGWKAELGLEDMCRDAWNWQKKNPNGYEA